MARIILVTGGSRSGKSRFAQQLAESLSGRRVFVATCEPCDEEMRQRIDRHRQQRDGAQWDTIEEPIRLTQALVQAADYDVVLIDCLTLWISNLLHQTGSDAPHADEAWMAERSEDLLEACRRHPGSVILVANEVGMGIVPDNPLARRFRDLVGRANQILAAAADRVVLMCCGIPVTLKGTETKDS